MNKEALIALGLTEGQAAKVMSALDGAVVPKTRFNEVNGELQSLKKTIAERDKQLEELKKSRRPTVRPASCAAGWTERSSSFRSSSRV